MPNVSRRKKAAKINLSTTTSHQKCVAKEDQVRSLAQNGGISPKRRKTGDENEWVPPTAPSTPETCRVLPSSSLPWAPLTPRNFNQTPLTNSYVPSAPLALVPEPDEETICAVEYGTFSWQLDSWEVPTEAPETIVGDFPMCPQLEEVEDDPTGDLWWTMTELARQRPGLGLEPEVSFEFDGPGDVDPLADDIEDEEVVVVGRNQGLAVPTPNPDPSVQTQSDMSSCNFLPGKLREAPSVPSVMRALEDLVLLLRPPRDSGKGYKIHS
ncbi:hypothetical protein DL96DRAFT_1713125 [Flagelloscypha sp. PMI_526]|nr:hypothetical protein DL96DRAFT_1713125 [Flagelloscypha sp. PMI_526]